MSVVFNDEIVDVARDDADNARANRMCEVYHLPTSTRAAIDLSWHVGRISMTQFGRPVRRQLKRGEKTTLPILRALSFFGPFTIPKDLESINDESKRADLLAYYRSEKARALLAFGDYPRPRKVSDGTDPIGPHRFPDIEVTVIEQDGERWEPIRLHELYQIGDYDGALELRPSNIVTPEQSMAAELEDARSRNDELERRLAQMEGKIQGIATVVRSNANGGGK